jgi:uncharacterized coiled-coil DUF342 family protein
MARPASFSAEEDQIILDTAGMESVETNRRLHEAGYKQRTAASIISRRKYLHRKGQGNRGDLVSLIARRERLLERMKEVKSDLEQVNSDIRDEMAEMERSLDLDPDLA